ncbi:hypothetical protein [Ornithinibacillus halotolerans]|uniref:Uncharacterized protein n=1 Tax=Ornithinibacillus halotolerans TaxID=1274357 RepID=A0A916RJU9_9BACI|nr:hypothetical protein [Ornithinibacillus halotolerans]GGA60101.1 hypothetical protein GCM10008025_00170 [Ornithinibacillus halotolerans]
MSKGTLLFWVFFAMFLFMSYHFHFYFINPLLVNLFQSDVMDLVVFPIIFVPVSAILPKIAKNFFLANNPN